MYAHPAIARNPIAWAALAREVIAFAIATGTGIVVWIRKRSARYWPITHGRVEDASSFENSGVWLTDISYSYSVAGEFYSGMFQVKARSEKKAAEDVMRWKGGSIGIRYSPKRPEVSVIRVEDQAGLQPTEFLGH